MSVTRRRLAVVILAPQDRAWEIDVLRRAVGAPEPFRVAPHCTLVSPTNVWADLDDAVDELLRDVASRSMPFDLDIGPVTSFAPATPTLHLAVSGPGEVALRSLRCQLRSGPFDREDQWPFTPHVTIQEAHPRDRIPLSIEVLRGVRQRWTVDRIHLLQQHRRDDGSPHWVPVREEPLHPAVVVGRGGVELTVRGPGVGGIRLVEPGAAALVGGLPPSEGRADPSTPNPGLDPNQVVITVERRNGSTPGPLVGAAMGAMGGDGTVWLRALAVQESERGMGIGAQLLSAWISVAAERGAAVVLAEPDDRSGGAFLDRHGFRRVGRFLVRSL